MSTPYDKFDYPSYWKGREYEQRSEELALKYLLNKIPKVENILDVGSGFGRLTNMYKNKGRSIFLSDPSEKLLKLSKKKFKNDKKIKYINSSLENLPNNIKNTKIDLMIMIRVMHHIRNCDASFESINNILTKDSYLILEFPNKRHLKNTIINIAKGNFKYLFDQLPMYLGDVDRTDKSMPFKNYHPDMIVRLLRRNGFSIISRCSVSNMRDSHLKKLIALKNLLILEKLLKKPFTALNFGPSIFILAKKE